MAKIIKTVTSKLMCFLYNCHLEAKKIKKTKTYKPKADISKKPLILINTLCISLIEMKSPSRSEHLCGKIATIGILLKGKMMILHKKVPYYLLEIVSYLRTTKCLKKYQRLQFYSLNVPILNETPYIVTKCTVQ